MRSTAANFFKDHHQTSFFPCNNQIRSLLNDPLTIHARHIMLQRWFTCKLHIGHNHLSCSCEGNLCTFYIVLEVHLLCEFELVMKELLWTVDVLCSKLMASAHKSYMTLCKSVGGKGRGDQCMYDFMQLC